MAAWGLQEHDGLIREGFFCFVLFLINQKQQNHQSLNNQENEQNTLTHQVRQAQKYHSKGGFKMNSSMVYVVYVKNYPEKKKSGYAMT